LCYKRLQQALELSTTTQGNQEESQRLSNTTPILPWTQDIML
jgi:hypothetical protein